MADATSTTAEPAPAKPKKIKAKDLNVPLKPMTPFQKIGESVRNQRRQELAGDIRALNAAYKEAYKAVPPETLEKMRKEYRAEMEIWKPKWIAYKETEEYGTLFEIKEAARYKRKRKKLRKQCMNTRVWIRQAWLRLRCPSPGGW